MKYKPFENVEDDSSEIAEHHHDPIKDMEDMDDSMVISPDSPSGIEGFYIMFDGCCNDTIPAHFTKAVTPKLNFEFLTAGWYWQSMVYPGFQNLFGFMIHGEVGLTTGTYCVRTGYHCICQPIAVPDLCNSKWSPKKSETDRKFAQIKSSDVHKIDEKPIWAAKN